MIFTIDYLKKGVKNSRKLATYFEGKKEEKEP